EAVGAGAVLVMMTTPESIEDVEIEIYKRKLLKRFRDMNYRGSSS
nr:ARM repeat superfamily protein [Tanacetum cinerariifolium]